MYKRYEEIQYMCRYYNYLLKYLSYQFLNVLINVDNVGEFLIFFGIKLVIYY